MVKYSGFYCWLNLLVLSSAYRYSESLLVVVFVSGIWIFLCLVADERSYYYLYDNRNDIGGAELISGTKKKNKLEVLALDCIRIRNDKVCNEKGLR